MTVAMPPEETKPAIGAIWKTGLAVTVVAVIVNVVIFLVASTFTFPDDALTPLGEPVGIPNVVALTAAGGIAATLGYTILSRLLSPTTARRVMLILAVIVLLVMIPSPLGIENVETAQIIAHQVLHVVAALPAFALARR